ncbi:sensor histidine kinase [Sorangium sp. So ce363]|uniref:sensor histidine kinase n=1 Tax=Sorangium sp. So ce363 TaxID=3133304 RepID=UPI003F5FA3E0
MKANTALAFLAAAASLWLHCRAGSSSWTRRLSRACAGGVAVVGLLTFLEYALNQPFHIDQILFREGPDAVGTPHLGRMAITTAICLLLLGSALWLLDVKARGVRRLFFAMVVPIALVGQLAVLGYVLGVGYLYGVGATTEMALHTALLFLVLSAGVLCARPELSGVELLMSAGAGGVMARRLILAAFGAPFVLGWVIVTGRKLGLYDSAFESSLLVVGCIVLIVRHIWKSAAALECIDRDRGRAVEDRGRLALREEAAQAAVRERDEFLSIASHELRTPIAALQLTLQALERRLGGDEPATLRHDPTARAVEGSLRQVARLTRLVDQLLDLSRIKAGRLELEPERVNLVEVVRQAVEPLRGVLMQAGCSLRLHVEREILGCWDALRIEQVVTNLVSNALKYGANAPVELSAQRRGDTAVIAVRDHGIGIAPENTARIFERFERAVSSRDYAGVGIGLFIARQIVEAHGGSIRVESALGMGSTFVVELPIEHAVEPLEATRTRPQRKRSQAKRRAPERTKSVVEDDVELSARLVDLLDKPSIP